MLRMQYVIDAINDIIKNVNNTNYIITVLETGTIRSYHEKHDSTLHIARTLGNLGNVISIDNSMDSINIAKDICNGLTNIKWIHDDSHNALKDLLKYDYKFDFIFLDSMNDRDFIFEEFKISIPMMKVNGILMVDDAGINIDGTGIDEYPQQKGERVWQFLKNNNYPVETKVIGHGMTQIKIVVTEELIKLVNSINS